MSVTQRIHEAALGWTLYVVAAASRVVDDRNDGRERGDVPGWVLITIMTAGLVTLLWGIAGDTFQRMFTAALAAVTGPR